MQNAKLVITSKGYLNFEVVPVFFMGTENRCEFKLLKRHCKNMHLHC